jgi:hypothetical protein
VAVFSALSVYWTHPSNLWSSNFVYSSLVVFAHVSPQGSGFRRCNLERVVSVRIRAVSGV